MKDIFENAELEVIELNGEHIIVDSVRPSCPSYECNIDD